MPKNLLPLPHIEQQSESDCLAACAAMVLAFLDFHVSYSRLLTILDIHPWGTPHRNIRKLTELFPGLRVTYKQGEPLDLFQLVDSGCPVIVFVWTGDLPYWKEETWHAVVIVGYDEGSFYVNDPAYSNAPQPVLHGDLELGWIAYDSYYAVIEKAH